MGQQWENDCKVGRDGTCWDRFESRGERGERTFFRNPEREKLHPGPGRKLELNNILNEKRGLVLGRETGSKKRRSRGGDMS